MAKSEKSDRSAFLSGIEKAKKSVKAVKPTLKRRPKTLAPHVIVQALAGTGKCLGLGTKVLMFDGSIKQVEIIRPGELLMGPDSKPRRVLKTNRGYGLLYRITPVKGDSWVCNDAHIMTLAGTNQKLGQVIDIPLSELISTTKKGRRIDRTWKLWRTAVSFQEQPVPLDPYLIGLWLGDGTRDASAITNGNPTIIDYCQNHTELYGHECITRNEPEGNTVHIRFRCHTRSGKQIIKKNRFLDNFRKCLNRKRQKIVPQVYLQNSFEVRAKVLAGYLDADGHVTAGGFDVVTYSPPLADQVLYLCRSLGLAAYKSEKVVKGYEHNQYWRISISGDFSNIPLLVKIPSKRRQVKRVNVTGFSAKEIGLGDYYGFTLDGDGRFLLGDFTVTHNTTTLIGALHFANGTKQKIEPSPQQLAIWELIASEKPASVCFVAFNKSIAEELQSRVPLGVQASTIHSLGRSLLARNPQFSYAVRKPNGWKTANILERLYKNDWKMLQRQGLPVNEIRTLVSLCKMNLVDPFLPYAEFKMALDQVATHHDIQIVSSRFDTTEVIQKVLVASLDMDGQKGSKVWMTEIDFDDMIWIPVMLNLFTDPFDLLLVDESQDLNRCQQTLVRNMGERLVFVGDKQQAIYGFAGADSQSMATLEQELRNSERGVQVLPLTMTRRCGKAIVSLAKELVPGFEAHESNPAGRIVEIEESELLSKVQDSHMCVCRVNAPLVSTCFRLLKGGRKARIQGRSIGEGLTKLINSLKADTVPELISKLDQWHQTERAKLEAKRFPQEAALIALGDKYDCLCTFTENCETIEDVLKSIDRIFKDEGEGVLLSSIHRAKGLEARTVWLLRPDLCPHPLAKLDWQKEQERNLQYVAYTRAIDTLGIVKKSETESKEF